LPAPGQPTASVEAASSPLGGWQAPVARNQDKGVLQGLKSNVSNMNKEMMDKLGNSDEDKAWKKAQEYEERRAAEEKEKSLRRMEETRRRRAERSRRT
jgi:YidC/Oxa1 family membrane protein insertase